ncbi:MAG: aminotransferase class III-fold pyridoxal phosphate-dependent enzyme [Paracoccaceae bacterium]
MTNNLIDKRRRLLGPNMSLFYDDPVHLVRGQGVWVFDADGRKYLDCYNNVPHVGHCHPHVVEAIAKQAATLNTHTRYLHDSILSYAERLTAKFDDPLSSMIMVCTGSEANDIALRMAEAVTGKRGIIVTDHTYHGNTTAVAALSSTNRASTSQTDHIRFVPAPDSYRPPHDMTPEEHAADFAHHVEKAIDDLERSGVGFAGLLICPFFANEGFPDLPENWLAPTVKAVKNAGGLLIADEVQPGFGRIGSHMWGHQYQGFTPDVVTLGKPMGNGHPVAAVITSDDIISAFRTSFRYFNTFGGNPVSVAAANAVLDVIETENLMKNADQVGAYAKAELSRLSENHPIIGNVRGKGLFFGTELVLDKSVKSPATDIAYQVANLMRQNGILMNKLGIHYNTTKMRPPMPFSMENADLMIEVFDHVLTQVESTL